MVKTRIVDYEQKLESSKKLIRDSKEIPKVNRDLILKFAEHCKTIDLTTARISKNVYNLNLIAKLFGKKSFKTSKKKDFEKLVNTIQNKEYSKWTKYDLQMLLKLFIRWVKCGNGEKEYPKEVKWINPRTPRPKKILDKDLLTHDDVFKLIKVCDNAKERAYIATLANSAGRAREVGELTIGNIQFDEDGVKILVTGKTGTRETRLTFAESYLREWYNTHPYNTDENCPLWINGNSKDVLSYNSLKNIIDRAKKKSGIKKKTNMHFFRKSWASFASQHLTPSQLSQQYGWVQGSRVLQNYIFPDRRQTDIAVIEKLGKKMPHDKLKMMEKDSKKKNMEEIFKVKICLNCGNENLATNKVCSECNVLLDSLKKLVAMEDKVISSARVLERISKILSEKETLTKDEYVKELQKVKLFSA